MWAAHGSRQDSLIITVRVGAHWNRLHKDGEAATPLAPSRCILRSQMLRPKRMGGCGLAALQLTSGRHLPPVPTCSCMQGFAALLSSPGDT